MKITLDKQRLSEVLGYAVRFVPSKSPTPAYEGVLLKAFGDTLTVIACESSMGLIAELPADIKEEGSIVLPAKLFTDMIRSMPDQGVTIASSDSLITSVTAGSSDFSIPGTDSSFYPASPSLGADILFSVNEAVLKSMIEQTLFAAATTDTKPTFMGLLFETENKVLTVVGIDGHRLAVRREFIPFEGNESFIVPAKALGEVSKLLSYDGERQVDIRLYNKHIGFSIGGYFIFTRQIEGEFFNYKSTIAVSLPRTTKINTRRFLEAVNRVSLLISDKLRSPIRLNIESEGVRLSCTTSIGTATDEVTAFTEGTELEIGFNNKYLSDALNAADTDEVIISSDSPVSPFIITPPEGDSFLFLVVPVKLR